MDGSARGGRAIRAATFEPFASRSRRSALLLSAAMSLCLGSAVSAQIFAGNDVTNGPFSSGNQTFIENSKLNANAANTVSGGTQDFYSFSTLNASVANAINGGNQYFYNASTLNASAANAVRGGFQFFKDTTTLNASVADAISGGTQAFDGSSTLSASVANAVSGGAQFFHDTTTLNAFVANAISGGFQNFYESSTLNLQTGNALTKGVAVQFDNRLGGPGGILKLNGYSTVVGGLNSLSAGSGLVTNGGAGDGTLTVDTSQLGDSFFSGVVQDGGAGALAIAKAGAGTLTLTGANTHTGGTTISVGTLQLGNVGALGAKTNKTTITGGVLALGGLEVTQNGGVELRGGTIENGTLISSGTFDVQAGTISAWLDGNGRLNKTTSGTVILTEYNTYGGGTRISEGTLKIGNDTALGSGIATFDGGTLANLNRADQLILGNLFTVTANGGTIDAGSGVLSNGVFYKGGLSFLNGISDGQTAGGKLTITGKPGESFVTFGASNSYSGPTEIAAGALLRAGAAGALSRRSDFIVDGDLQLNGIDQTVRSLTGGGTVANAGAASATLTIDMPNGSATFDGRIIDDGGALALVKTGAGTQILTGFNSYSGGTTISQGTLQVDSGGSLGTGTVTLDGGTLCNGDLLGSGPFLTNRFEINATGGTIDAGQGGIAIMGGVADGATSGGTLTIAGVSGSGVVMLLGNNSYSGDTIVTGGTLLFGPGAVGSGISNLGGNVQVNSGANLAIWAQAAVTIAKDLTLADNTALSIETASGAPSLKARGVTIGQGVAFNLEGVSDPGGAEKVLIDTTSGITGDFAKVTIGGFAGPVDYLTLTTAKSDDNLRYLASYGLSWAAGNNLAHGTFTLADATDTFTVSTALSDRAANVDTGWDGKALMKAGAGTLILSADNSYSGGTTIAGGTLQLGNGGAAGSIAGDVVNDGVLAFNRNNAMTVAGNISGSGAVKQIGSGTTILTGTNSYAGGTVIAAGTLQVSADGNLGNASGGLTLTGGALATTADFVTGRAVTLTDSGRFDVAAGTGLGLTGTVSGAGDLVKSGAGTLSLTGTNAYGNTLVRAGTLVGNTSSISGNIGNSGTVVFDQAEGSTYAGTISGIGGLPNGAMVKRGTGKLTLAGTSALDWSVEAGSLVSAAERFSGNVAINADAAFAFDQATNASYAGVISGAGGFSKLGSGALKLTGDSATFSGTTTVQAGMLSVDGKLGGTLGVLNGARLQGNGTLGSLVVANDGTVAPGNSIGTLNVAGDVSLAAGSTYEVEIAGNGTSDRIAAGGNAALGGGKVAVTALDAQTSYQNGQTYTILTAAGGITGGFDAAVLSRSAFLDATLLQGAKAVDLKIAIKGTKPEEPGKPGGKPLFITVADTFNRKQTAGALDTLQQSGTSLALYNKLLLLSADEARSAFDQLSGEAQASTVTGLIGDSQLIQNAINDRLRTAFETVGAEPLPLMGYGEEDEITTASVTAAERYGAWSSAFGSWGSANGNGNAAKLSRSTGGFVTGIDGAISDNWRLGFLAGFSHSSFKVDDRKSSASSDNYHLGFYGGGLWGALSVRSGVAYTWSDIDSSRQVVFPGFTDALSSSYRAGTTQVFGELGYGIKAGAVAFEPFANLAYVNVHTNGFTEKGGAAALAVQGGSNAITFTTIGVRAATDFDLGTIKATARGMVGWRHAFGDVTPTVSQAFAGSTAFTIAGAPIARESAALEAGFDVQIAPAATLGISYQGQLAAKARDHGVRADLNVRF